MEIVILSVLFVITLIVILALAGSGAEQFCKTACACEKKNRFPADFQPPPSCDSCETYLSANMTAPDLGRYPINFPQPNEV